MDKDGDEDEDVDVDEDEDGDEMVAIDDAEFGIGLTGASMTVCGSHAVNSRSAERPMVERERCFTRIEKLSSMFSRMNASELSAIFVRLNDAGVQS